MNWILLVMGAIVSVVAAVIAGGLLLPATYDAQRVMHLRTSPDRVREALRDLGEWPVWMALARTPQMDPVDADTVMLALTTDDQQVANRLQLRVEPHDAGTRVVARDQGRVSNPVARLLRHYVTGQYGTVDATLRALAEALDEPAELVGS